jgi:hypothetical protein
MVVPLVVWLALQMLEMVAPLVAIFSVQFVTAAPVFLIVTLWQNPPLQELVVSSVAVTEPELTCVAACSATETSPTVPSVQPPMNAVAATAHEPTLKNRLIRSLQLTQEDTR